MTSEEITWAVVAIVVTVITASYGKETRAILDKVPQGYRAVRIEMLRVKIWKYTKPKEEAQIRELIHNVSLLWYLLLIYCLIAIYWILSQSADKNGIALVSAVGATFSNAYIALAESFRRINSEEIVKSARAKLTKYGIVE